MDPMIRFWSYVKRTDSCWIWIGYRTRDGYGRFKAGGRTFQAYRWIYEKLVGPIPEGLQIDHVCHTEDPECAGGWSCPHRACVNPDHMEPVTRKENTLRGRSFSAENATKTHCKRGHPYGESPYVDSFGSRHCSECRRIRQRVSGGYGPSEAWRQKRTEAAKS